MLETLDYTIRIGSIPTFLYFDLFIFRTVTCTEVQRIILSIPSKSPDPDKINPRVINECLPVILAPLTDIMNCTHASCTFPDVWKLAAVIPLLKKSTRWHRIIDLFLFWPFFLKSARELPSINLASTYPTTVVCPFIRVETENIIPRRQSILW